MTMQGAVVHRVLDIQLEDGTLLKACSPAELAIHTGDQCVVDFHHVPEYGKVMRLVERPGDLPARGQSAVVMRRATLQDQSRARENAVVGRMAARTVGKRVEADKLPIHVVQVRYSFDRAVLHVTYTSEERVECAEAARALSSELRTRVELRNIGVRDSARLIGGMGMCGRTLCCRTWMKEFDGVSVKMAKAQRLALNPSSIGGACGRLKCCLKYEFDCYRRLGERLPRDGARVCCGEGQGCVVDKDILRQRIKVRMDDGRVMDFDNTSVKAAEMEGGKPGRQKEKKR